jgi:transposase
MPEKRRRFTKAFKLKVVRAYLDGKSIGEIIREFDIHQNLVYKWTQEYQANPTGAFRGSTDDEPAQTNEQRIAELERTLGRMTPENEFLNKALSHTKTILERQEQDNTKP